MDSFYVDDSLEGTDCLKKLSSSGIKYRSSELEGFVLGTWKSNEPAVLALIHVPYEQVDSQSTQSIKCVGYGMECQF